MKIYGTGRVWDPVRHELAWEFPKAPRGELAVFETDNAELVALAVKNGFLVEGDPVVAESEKADAPEVAQEPSVDYDQDQSDHGKVVGEVVKKPKRGFFSKA